MKEESFKEINLETNSESYEFSLTILKKMITIYLKFSDELGNFFVGDIPKVLNDFLFNQFEKEIIQLENLKLDDLEKDEKVPFFLNVKKIKKKKFKKKRKKKYKIK